MSHSHEQQQTPTGKSGFSFFAPIRRLLEKEKLLLRANKYRNKEDKGGIQYIIDSVQPGDIVFDIGAHKGGYLYFMHRGVGEGGHVYAFEPQQVLYTYLVRIKQLLRWRNVTIESHAVSDTEGSTTLFIPYNHGSPTAPGATIVDKKENAAERQELQPVIMVTLDDYCGRKKIRPAFLKIDVEGNELHVFRGARKILQEYKPRILFECEARHVGEQKLMETLAYLQELGYTGYFIQDDQRLPVAQFSVKENQNDSVGIFCNNFIFE